MNVIDSSGWLEYFTDGPNADFFRSAIMDEEHLIIPTICLYEVFKITFSRAGEDEALRIAGLMSFGKITDMDREIAIAAAHLSIQHRLAMADSLILATARAHEAALWTQDEHFKDIPGVNFVEKK
jgi:predicted nucleic acid-binding protein